MTALLKEEVSLQVNRPGVSMGGGRANFFPKTVRPEVVSTGSSPRAAQSYVGHAGKSSTPSLVH